MNTLPITATLSGNSAYWLIYNANGPNPNVDNMLYNNDPAMVAGWAPQPFGTWPATFGASTLAGQRYSIFATGT